MTQPLRLVLMILAFVSWSFAVRAETPCLGLDVLDLHATTPGYGTSKDGILFSDEPLRVRVDVVPGTYGGDRELKEVVQLSLKSSTARSEILLTGGSYRASKGDGSKQGVLEFPPLPAGDYEVVAVDKGSGAEVSRPVRFVVRVGDESDGVRRIWLRVAAEKARSNRASVDPMGDYRKLMMKLAELEPANPSIWEEIADSSIDAVPPAETIELYRKAHEIAKRNVEARLAEGGDREHVTASWNAYAHRVLTYERHHEEYLERRTEVTMHIFRDGQGGKRYALLDKATGGIVKWLE